MLNLASETDGAWVERAVGHLDEILLDHAHCEKKAAGTALRLLFQYPHHLFLQAPLSRLAREELQHFEQVLSELEVRGIAFARQRPSAYGGRLHQAIRGREPERLLDWLLVCALIEARSCERFRLLADALAGPSLAEAAAVPPLTEAVAAPPLTEAVAAPPLTDAPGDPPLAALYRGLLACEARHHQSYIDLATHLAPVEVVRSRLSELARCEADALAEPEELVRLHSGRAGH